jgi:DNA-binding XRE family transcriptional regulator
MLEHMKTPHTSGHATAVADIFKVICPPGHAEAVRAYLVSKGCILEEFVSPTEVFPNRSPATLLRGVRSREGLTQQELADMCGISRHHISEMENNKRSIGKRNAGRLGLALNVDPRLFL